MTGRAALRFLMIVGVSVVLAPPLGGLAFFTVLAAINLVTDGIDGIADIFVIVALGTYVVGVPIALLGGILVALVSLWRIPTLPVVLATILAANGVCLVVQPLIGFGVGGFLINCAASLFAGTICWLLFPRSLRTA